MNTQQRIEVERKIVAFLFDTMSQHGWQVDYIFDLEANVKHAEWAEAAVLDTVFSADEVLISFVKATGCRGRTLRSVHIVLDNRSWDCINDSSASDPDNTEDDFDVVMKLVNTFAEQFEPDSFAPKPPPGYTAKELERDNPYNAWMRDVES